jgi:hypothetical protein
MLYCIAHYSRRNEGSGFILFILGAILQRKKLKADAVPSIFTWSVTPSASATARAARVRDRRSRCSATATATSTSEPMPGPADVILSCDIDGESIALVEEVEADSNVLVDASVQTDIDNAHYNRNVSVVSSQTQTLTESIALDIEHFKNDDCGLQFYTGLDNCTVFSTVLASLGPAAYQLNYLYGRNPTLGVQNQLLLTLIKLRTYKTNFELSRMFRIPESDVYIIFVTWVKFMSLQWREINLWPAREVVDFYAPFDFRDKFPTTRVIIDGTEIPIKVPAVPAAQQITFSTYKNRNTAKALIGVSPGGLISFVSDCYGGTASDRQIVERTYLRDVTEPGDSIMADKGFDVQDIFASRDVTINIPTFFRKRNRFSQKTVMRDRKIASKRVHVERAIGLAKTFKILKHPLNQTESVLSSDIVFVCFMLVNFRRCIVPKNA